jgi:FKBP-type peptidyl-prolyl cis-trans isomerase FkpA
MRRIVAVMSNKVLAVMLGAAIISATPAWVHAQSGRWVDAPLDTAQFAAALDVDLTVSKRVVRGLYARDFIVGTGRLATRGDELTVRYTGALADGRGFTGASEPPVTFKLGAGTVIGGWDRGLSGMRVGGRRQLVIAPDLGYGGKQAGVIPPNSVLVFEIELLSVR